MTLRYDVRIARLPGLTMFNARGAPAGLERAIRRAGLGWPARMQWTEADADGVEALRLGPRNVVAIAPPEREASLSDALERAFADEAEADVANVTDMHAAFSVSGPGAESVLRQGAPLDLSATVFPPGVAAGTELWAVTAIILRRADAYLVVVDASHAGYIAEWLAVASGAPPSERPGTMANPPPQLRPS